MAELGDTSVGAISASVRYSLLKQAAWANARRPEIGRVGAGTGDVRDAHYCQGRSDALRDLCALLYPLMESGDRGDLIHDIEADITITMTSRPVGGGR